MFILFIFIEIKKLLPTSGITGSATYMEIFDIDREASFIQNINISD